MNRQEKRKRWNKYRKGLRSYIRQAEKYNTENNDLINKHIDLLKLLYSVVYTIGHEEYFKIRNSYGWLSKTEINIYKSVYYDKDKYERLCEKVNRLPVQYKRDALIDELLAD